MKKIQVFHFHNGTGGGVLSVIRNLLRYKQSDEIENHVIYTINKDQNLKFDISYLEGASTQQVFYYSSKWNFYYTSRQLAKLLPDDRAVIVAHDWLELGMVSNLGLQNPVVQYLHGAYEYYYGLAVKHSPWVDCYITVSQHIKNELIKRLPQRTNETHYLRFPVPNFVCDLKEKTLDFNIVFAARCELTKGYPLLPKIENELQRRGIKVKWHIAGQGSKDINNQKLWNPLSDVKFYGLLSPCDVIKLLCKSQIIILPSIAEGMPLSVVEAMKVGVVPLVNNLEGGLQELVQEDVTGYLVTINNFIGYADVIEMLRKSPERLNKLSLNAKKLSHILFDRNINAKFIERLYFNEKFIKRKYSKKEYGSILDQKYLLNFITFRLRNIFKFLR